MNERTGRSDDRLFGRKFSRTFRCVAKLHTPDQGRVLMGIYRILARKLKGIQDTTFSIDALGHYICNSWDQVDAANDSKPFNIVIIGAGMFGAYCAEKCFAVIPVLIRV